MPEPLITNFATDDPLEFVERLDVAVIRKRLEVNVRERAVLRRLLKLAEQTHGVQRGRREGGDG